MKYLFFTLVLLAQLGNAQQAPDFTPEVKDDVTLSWFYDFDTAAAVAKSQKKPMIVYFTGTDWCPPCKRLKRDFFDTTRFEDLSRDYIIVMLDVPYRDDIISLDQKKLNKKTQKELGIKVFPTIVALDYKGKEKNRIERYSFPDPQYHWEFMEKNKSLFKL